MSATKLIEWLLQEEPLSGILRAKAHTGLPAEDPRAAEVVVGILLDEAQLGEATVRRPKRGSIFVASFTGPAGGQVWRSTDSRDREQALALAKRWEAEARIQRTSLGGQQKKPSWRVRRREPGAGSSGPLTQKEVAQILHLSERAVREIERRAIRKLKSHPLLRHVWQNYLAGELDEDELRLTAAEIAALFSLAQNPAEQRLIQRILRLTQAR